MKPNSDSSSSGWLVRGFAQGIEMGEEMAEVAVGVDEADEGGLRRSVRGGGPARRGRLRRAQLEALEEIAPAVVHRLGVPPPALVGRLDGVQVKTIGNRTMTHSASLPEKTQAAEEGPVISFPSII